MQRELSLPRLHLERLDRIYVGIVGGVWALALLAIALSSALLT